MITRIVLPTPLAAEHAAYRRAISRSYAEWPLVEVCARVTIAEAARLATSGTKPPPMTAYKLDLLEGLVRDILEGLAG